MQDSVKKTLSISLKYGRPVNLTSFQLVIYYMWLVIFFILNEQPWLIKMYLISKFDSEYFCLAEWDKCINLHQYLKSYHNLQMGGGLKSVKPRNQEHDYIPSYLMLWNTGALKHRSCDTLELWSFGAVKN